MLNLNEIKFNELNDFVYCDCSGGAVSRRLKCLIEMYVKTTGGREDAQR